MTGRAWPGACGVAAPVPVSRISGRMAATAMRFMSVDILPCGGDELRRLVRGERAAGAGRWRGAGRAADGDGLPVHAEVAAPADGELDGGEGGAGERVGDPLPHRVG